MSPDPRQAASDESNNTLPIGDQPHAEQISFEVTKGWGFNVPPRTMSPFISFIGLCSLVAVMVAVGLHYGKHATLYVAAAAILSYLVWKASVSRPGVVSFPKGEFLASNPSARLRVQGTRRELAELAGIENIAFEPLVFRQHFRMWILVPAVIISCGVFGILMFALPISPSAGAFGLMATPFAAFLAWGFEQFFPTYYRIVPGRMDVLRFSIFQNKGKVIASRDLRNYRIEINFRGATVKYTDEMGKAETTALISFERPYEFARAVLLGAVSTSVPATLPSDDLLN